eukprot:gnl/MRDRNA2_/MRDRNA2_56269_c0_seq1.p1 gnl/MRDRNA2_/MRDRNA2_56269_c0~~gnl/MRDRNA2_/MRDRNA2_56269_c0_seq1.p1  ORF type:complete len:393 (+),score=47.55 gnl/MRDRNA2_/MRDRNA2_56269_c0_seq1:92-1270(+)
MPPLLDTQGSEIEIALKETAEPLTSSVSVVPEDRARRTILAMRLGKPYYVYCIICLLLAGTVFISTQCNIYRLKSSGKTWRHQQWQPWEEALNALVGIAVCTETAANIWLLGVRDFSKDCWMVLDGIICIFTVLTWILLILRSAARDPTVEDEIQEVDADILPLRFVLQSCRIITTLSMVNRARIMHRSNVDVEFGDDFALGGDSPVASGYVLTSELREEISAYLPVALRFRQWNLAYSPRRHGVSINTFYRMQNGPNVIIVRDTNGGTFGGFAMEPWRSSGHGYGTGENFVFKIEGLVTVSPLSLRVFPAKPKKTGSFNLSAQWSDDKMLAMGGAVVIRSDFLQGSCTEDCEDFGAPILSGFQDNDFIVQDFECWSLGVDESQQRRLSMMG